MNIQTAMIRLLMLVYYRSETEILKKFCILSKWFLFI